MMALQKKKKLIICYSSNIFNLTVLKNLMESNIPSMKLLLYTEGFPMSYKLASQNLTLNCAKAK